MVPHKDPASLPVSDQLKLLREDLEEIQLDTTTINMKLRHHDNQFKLIKSELKELTRETRNGFKNMEKAFARQEQAFVKWRNEIFTKIDGSYAKPIFDLQSDNTASLFRQKVQQEEIDKLKTKVFGSATA